MNCLMIPIHPPKINWLYMFLQSINVSEFRRLKRERSDLVLLVSTDFEKMQLIRGLQNIAPKYLPFIKFLDIGLYIKAVLKNNELLDRFLSNTFGCIVNLKKWCGLHWAMSRYQNIAVIDCDTLATRCFNLEKLFDAMSENYDSGLYFGAAIKDQRLMGIVDKCISFFDESDHQKIIGMNGNLYVYTWFFDVPFYKSKDLFDFFEWVLSDDRANDFWLEQNWHSFEHIVFVYYRCIYKGARIIDYSYSTSFGEPEVLTVGNILYLQYLYNYTPVWVKFSTVVDAETVLMENENIYLMYHTDRI